MIEFDVDMSYLLEYDELDKVVLNDEDGEHEPMEFVLIAATVGERDTMGLCPEWEQVLFANVSDEVAQDNLNECVHELLDKAAMLGVGTCTIEPHGYYDEQHGIYTCSSCGQQWQFEVEGPMEHGWTCCPHCRARIKEDAE